ncbi:YkyA family protein [Oceanobacillus caeni]|uniref:YkyA family protein n=1 Tax=Bacillaceae TaxID=186817 RepID=UPI001CDAA871|nr:MULTISPECIES: YkyA family protein [Bacillaceae]MCR1835844.1 YkyA family protein [Oceanobacillus caeni]
MLFRIRKTIIFFNLFILIVLSACKHTTAEEEIYTYLEEAVRIESEFIGQQNKITNLEAEEQKIYKQIIDLGTDNKDEIKKLAKEAIGNINKRSELIDMEKENMESSKEVFQKTEDYIEKIKDQDARRIAGKLYNKMEKRYLSYNELNKTYIVSLELETELYEMLQKQDLKQEDLTKQINKINKGYEKVLDANEKFNTYTIKYNELKREFYTLANIDVTYEEPTIDEEIDKKGN